MSEWKCSWREPGNPKLSNWISLCYKWPAMYILLLLSDTKNWLGFFSNTRLHTRSEVFVNTQSQQISEVDARAGPFRLVKTLIWSSFCEASTHYLKMFVKGIIISLAVLLFIPSGNISWIKHGNLSTHYDTWMTIKHKVLAVHACFPSEAQSSYPLYPLDFFINVL